MIYKTLFQRIIGDAKNQAPFFHGVRFSKRCDQVTRRAIVIVYALRNPPAIIRGVPHIVVNAINR
jgi:hypothetical protein